MLEIIGLVLNIFFTGFLAFEAFRQKERADRLEALNADILDNNDNLIQLNRELMSRDADSDCEECSGHGGRWDDTGVDQWYPCRSCSEPKVNAVK